MSLPFLDHTMHFYSIQFSQETHPLASSRQRVFMTQGAGNLGALWNGFSSTLFSYETAISCSTGEDRSLQGHAVAGLTSRCAQSVEITVALIPGPAIDVMQAMGTVGGEGLPVTVTNAALNDGPRVSLELDGCNIVIGFLVGDGPFCMGAPVACLTCHASVATAVSVQCVVFLGEPLVGCDSWSC